MFQSMHPRGVRPGSGDAMVRPVSIHAPTWGATRADRVAHDCGNVQSTHPRGVRRCSPRACAEMHVSIHAPTWGAPKKKTHCRNIDRFNPRTHVGCDVPRRVPVALVCFNPRTHVGCDVDLFSARPSDLVSIHAPTWGATWRWVRNQGDEVSITHPRGVRRVQLTAT